MNDAKNAPEGLRQRKQRETRLSLSHATIRLCLQRGWANVTIEEIAEAANVSPRTFRNYFATKAEAVAAGHLERMLRIADTLSSLPANENLWSAITNSVVSQFEPPKPKNSSADARAWLANIQFVLTEPAIRGEVLKASAAAQAPLADAIATRLRIRRTDDLYPELLAATVIAAVGLVMDRWLKSGPTGSVIPQLRTALAMLAEGMQIDTKARFCQKREGN